MKLDPVGSTVRYEVMEPVIDVTGSEEGIYAFIYWTEWICGQVLPMPDWLTDWQTLKDRATQLLIGIRVELCCVLAPLGLPLFPAHFPKLNLL